MKEAFSLSFWISPPKNSQARLFWDHMEYLGEEEIALDEIAYHFVGSLKPYDYKHFMEIPVDKFQLVPVANGEESEKKDEIYAYRTQEEVLGGERTIVVTYERKLYVMSGT
jgi:hypothetical protein